MANNSGEKTEQPTSKRLRDARKKGQVAKSQEVSSAASIVASFVLMVALWDDFTARVHDLFVKCIAATNESFERAVWIVAELCFEIALFICVPLLFGIIVLSLASQFAQFGVLISFEGAKPSLDKLNPQQWVKKVFSKKGLLELCKTIIKVILLGSVLYIVVKNNVDALLKAGLRNIGYFLQVFGETIFDVLITAASIFMVVAAVDYFFQKRFHIKELMMSKDEVKREYKEMEGDPHIKSQRKQLHKEIINNNNMNAAAQATVLVTNPTHIAVALHYAEGETPLPMITGMGQGTVALKMMEIAEKNNVPIMRNVPLARSLHNEGRSNDYIPRELMQPVAEVIRWVKNLSSERHI